MSYDVMSYDVMSYDVMRWRGSEWLLQFLSTLPEQNDYKIKRMMEPFPKQLQVEQGRIEQIRTEQEDMRRRQMREDEAHYCTVIIS